MEGEKNKGGWWKALGHIQSQYASFFSLCSLQSNAIGTEKWIWKEWSPLFSYQLPRHCVLETGDLKTHCSSRHFAHDFFFRVRLALVRVLGPKPISGSALAVKRGIKNQLSTLRLFYFPVLNDRRVQIKSSPNLNSVWKKKSILSLKWFQKLML